MSGWRSKSSNKKFDNKQISKTDIKPIKTDYNSSLPVPINSIGRTTTTTTTVEDSNTAIQDDEMKHRLYDWQLLEDRKRLPKFFRFGSSSTSLTKKEERQQPISDSVSVEESIEWAQILDREFQALDIDKDGYVSIADLQTVLKNFSHLCNSNEIMVRVFEELDRNHDKRISKEEFKLYKNILLDKQKRLNRSTFEDNFGTLFALFDRNQDNYITPHEIRETMRNLGEHIDDTLIEEMMKTADTDHDGRISREEFKKLLIQLYSKQ